MRNPVEARKGRQDASRELAAPLLGVHLAHEQPAQLLASGHNVLGVVSFGAGPPAGSGDPRHVRVPLPLLAGAPAAEVWTTSLPVERGSSDGIGYAHNGEVVLAQITIPESMDDDFEDVTYQAYARIRSFLESQGYPYPVRIWNYFPWINQGVDDAERYKQFCLGRARAIQDSPDYELRLPAASAIGSDAPEMVIYLFAARQTGIQIENPRQVSAFHYPRQYGPKSPSFSRARLMNWSGDHHLYLSGTSSVVGHETLHENNCAAQFKETLRNIETLLAQAAEADPVANLGWDDLTALRVYLRHERDLSMAQENIRSCLGADAPVVFLRGDICRNDLMLEIEGIFTARIQD